MPAPCLKKDVEIKILQIKHKIPIWNCISGGLGDWHSSCILYNYTTTTFLIIYYPSSRLIPLLDIINAPIQVPDIVDLTVSSK